MSKEIYTDGACKGNPGSGGWGFVVFENNKELNRGFGGARQTTNNQMEMTAAIEGLKQLSEGESATLYTDSKYVIQGITEWIHGWKRKNWKTATGGDVKNEQLWKLMDSLNSKRKVTWKWVKGHSGNAGNEIADQMANNGVISNGKR